MVNVYKSDKEITSEKKYQKLLQSLLNEYELRFHFECNENFIACLNNYIKENAIDLIITVPKKHNFFELLFKKEGHLKKMAFHSSIPLMCIHEEDL